MKILISAYACEPNSGSEPFLGWRWATEIAKHHEVYIITKENNKDCIEKYLTQNGNPFGMKFLYIGLPKELTFWKRGRRGMKLYYYMWQKKALKEAKKLHAIEHFDLVHHITFGAYTQPTYMYKLDIPFVWGPLGGGERMPKIKGRPIDFLSRVYELARATQIKITNYLPYARKSMEKATKIIVTTEETKARFSKKYHSKIEVFQSLGIDEQFMQGTVREKVSDKVRIFMVGRMIGWKGFDIGIAAFKKCLEKHKNVELYVRGNGSLKQALKDSCGMELNKTIFFIEEYLNYEDMYGMYAGFDIFMNATLHDSGCLALLEAMSAGLPIVCVNVGGPKVLTDESHAIKVNPCEYEKLIERMSVALNELIVDESKRVSMGKASKEKVISTFLYDVKYKFFDEIYKDIKMVNHE